MDFTWVHRGLAVAVDLSRIGERDRLKQRPGDEPHWQRLRQGVYLGFRVALRGGRGTWFVRAYDEEAKRYKRKALGDFSDLTGHDVFAAARKAAEEFGTSVAAGGVAQHKLETVADACREYMKGRPEAEGRFNRFLYNDPLAGVKLDRLRRHHLEAWRKRLEAEPALVSRARAGEKRTRKRAPSTVNRDIVPLRAALTKVLAPGAPGSPAAWQEALLPIRNADRQRTLYLDKEQRRRLVAALDAEAVPFVTALCLLPLRPGAMSNLSAGDFDKRTRELSIGKDKSGKPRRITLPAGATALLTKQVKDKLPTAPLFPRSNGKRWNKDNWNEHIKAASQNAGYDPAVTAYVFRHSVITDLINGGLAILTVAQISDTSVEMIERHYGHLNRSAAEDALATLAL